MTRSKLALIGGSLLAALAVAGLSISRPAVVATVAAGAVAPPVRTAIPKTVRAHPHETVTGTLAPAKALQMGFEVSGRLSKIRVRKGEQVHEGQVLAELDPEIADAQVAQAEAAVAAAEAGANIASDVAGRNATLVKEGDVSDLQSKTSTATAQQASAQHLVAKAALSQARANRKRQDLKAPFAGTIIDAPDQTGATVSPIVPLFTLEQIDPLVLKTTVPEEIRGRLTVGTKVHVAAVSGRVETDQATIRNIVPSADPATRRIPVEIEVPNQDDRFVAHTLAKADLDLGGDQEALSIPATALASNGGDHVFSIGTDGRISRVPVEVVQRGAQEILVKAPHPLERIVDYPAVDLTDGTKVSVK